VGVLATEFDAESDAERTTVLFDSIQVLAVDGDTESTGLLAGDQRQKEAIVTLAVPEESVASLLSSYSNGDITLVLLEDGEKLPMVQKG
jgi:Flp pilus assembly protein CpaB